MNLVRYLFSISILVVSLIFSTQAVGAETDVCKSDLTMLVDLSSAPAKVRDAAKGVVRIKTHDGAGTGFFLKTESMKVPMLITNDHVVGTENCTREGCYISIDFDFQRGSTWKASKEVFVKPLVNNGELDFSVFEVHEVGKDGAVGKVFISEHTVKMITTEPKRDKGIPLFAVGHPHGGLKKWSGGKCAKTEGDWRTTNHCCLGGSSGSPVVNEAGESIGILHRGAGLGDEVIDLAAQRHITDFSSSAPVLRFIESQLKNKKDEGLKEYPSIAKDGTLDDESDPDDLVGLYLSRRIPNAVLDKDDGKVGIAKLLLDACTEEVKDGGKKTKADVTFPVCKKIFSWLNCNEPKTDAYYKSCPAAKEKKAWKALFSEIVETLALRNQSHEFWMADAPAAFETSKRAAATVKLEGYRQHFIDEKTPFELHVAAGLASVAVQKEDLVFKGEDVSKTVLDFRKIELHDLFFEDVIDSVFAMHEHKLITNDQFTPVLTSLLSDKKLPATLKLEVESLAFEKGHLK